MSSSSSSSSLRSHPDRDFLAFILEHVTTQFQHAKFPLVIWDGEKKEEEYHTWHSMLQDLEIRFDGSDERIRSLMLDPLVVVPVSHLREFDVACHSMLDFLLDGESSTAATERNCIIVLGPLHYYMTWMEKFVVMILVLFVYPYFRDPRYYGLIRAEQIPVQFSTLVRQCRVRMATDRQPVLHIIKPYDDKSNEKEVNELFRLILNFDVWDHTHNKKEQQQQQQKMDTAMQACFLYILTLMPFLYKSQIGNGHMIGWIRAFLDHIVDPSSSSHVKGSKHSASLFQKDRGVRDVHSRLAAQANLTLAYLKGDKPVYQMDHDSRMPGAAQAFWKQFIQPHVLRMPTRYSGRSHAIRILPHDVTILKDATTLLHLLSYTNDYVLLETLHRYFFHDNGNPMKDELGGEFAFLLVHDHYAITLKAQILSVVQRFPMPMDDPMIHDVYEPGRTGTQVLVVIRKEYFKLINLCYLQEMIHYHDLHDLPFDFLSEDEEDKSQHFELLREFLVSPDPWVQNWKSDANCWKDLFVHSGVSMDHLLLAWIILIYTDSASIDVDVVYNEADGFNLLPEELDDVLRQDTIDTDLFPITERWAAILDNLYDDERVLFKCGDGDVALKCKCDAPVPMRRLVTNCHRYLTLAKRYPAVKTLVFFYLLLPVHIHVTQTELQRIRIYGKTLDRSLLFHVHEYEPGEVLNPVTMQLIAESGCIEPLRTMLSNGKCRLFNSNKKKTTGEEWSPEHANMHEAGVSASSNGLPLDLHFEEDESGDDDEKKSSSSTAAVPQMTRLETTPGAHSRQTSGNYRPQLHHNTSSSSPNNRPHPYSSSSSAVIRK
jgi:hypothetical protein